MQLAKYAEEELRKAGWFNNGEDSLYGGMIGPAVLEMVRLFAAEGHSGLSAPVCLGLFQRVAAFKPLSPIEHPLKTGEYQKVGEGTLQSTRLFSLFSDDGGRTWHDINLRVPKVWKYLLGRRWVNVAFPYSPK